MDKKFPHNLVSVVTRVDLVVMVLFCLVVLWLNLYAGIACFIVVGLLSIFHATRTHESSGKILQEYEEEVLRRRFEELGLNEDGSRSGEALNAQIEHYRKRLEENQGCIALVYIDNYDELLSSSPVEQQSGISAELDRKIRSWAQGLDASVIRIKDSRYIVQFEQKYLQIQKRSEFPIINQMHDVETGADFPTSISIGIGAGSDSFSVLQNLADDAIDLAMGRGGDQVVIKYENGEVEYFGGSLPSVEKRNKGKARIMAHALMQVVSSSSKVFIMGHKRPDMDSIGSAIGMHAFARSRGKDSYIILNEVGNAIDILYAEAEKTGEYEFIGTEDALQLADSDSMIIVVDTHIPALSECPEILDEVKTVVVIDHHRKSKDAIENPTIIHMESYASSTSELVTEILQYAVDKDEISDFEAEALLAGIMVDTKSFVINTGVRTFEAAAWLKRVGADSTSVRRFFRMNIDFFKKKCNIINNAEILGGGVAVAYTKDSDPDMQVIVAQAADELLDMRGVNAAFTAGRSKDRTLISGRSLDKVNVQTVLEKLGGGGHINIAAAQVEEGPEEAIASVVKIMREIGCM